LKKSAKQGSGDPKREKAEGSRRKLIEFDAETWHAIHLLSRDSLKSLQELATEAFNDLLKKHHRPTTLKQALRESARRHPANDPAPGGKKRGSRDQ
jgi:hypothetical protein